MPSKAKLIQMAKALEEEYRRNGEVQVAPYGLRHDSGMLKGKGYFGELPTADGVMTELSASDDAGDFPLIVPTLTREELKHLQSGGEPTEQIYAKAKAWAESRKGQGRNPFATSEDLRMPLPEYRRGGRAQGDTLASMDTGKVEMGQGPGGKKAEEILSAAAEFIPGVGASKAALEGEYASALLQGAMDLAGGSLAKGAAALGGKAIPALAGIVGKDDILRALMDLVLKEKGLYGARRVERAADEIPNLTKMYSPKALERAFTGDNAAALITLDPKRFEKFSSPLIPDTPGAFNKSLGQQKHIEELKKVGPFDDVPFLQIDKEEFGLPVTPRIAGHEGRHRSRALAERGEQKGLVLMLPRAGLREPLPRHSQEQYIDALREELGLTDNMVMPEFYREPQLLLEESGIQRPAIKLPEIYKTGGEVHMDGIGKNVGRGMAGLTRSRQELDPKDIQAMFLDVPAALGTPFAEAGAEYLRGNIEDAKTSAVIDAALSSLPVVGMAAKPVYRAAKKAAPAVREAARGALERSMESGAIVDPRMPVIAYHGTPHRFEKFDASKIGTGEGNQYYGHGIYFAESPSVASFYKTKLSERAPASDEDISFDVSAFIGDDVGQHAADRAQEIHHRGSSIEYIFDDGSVGVLNNDGVFTPYGRPAGHLYTVDIPDESIARMFDLDKPLSKQPKVVQDMAKNVDLSELKPGNKTRVMLEKWKAGQEQPEYPATGHTFYNAILDYGNMSPPDISEALRKAGIPGVKYLDAASRSVGEGTRNFVVFPGEEETVKILERKKKGGKVKPLEKMFRDQRQQAVMDFDNAMKKRVKNG